MPIWSRIRPVRRALPAFVLGVLATAGCQTDQGSRWSMPSLMPSSWFGRNETKPADDEFQLLPVPQGGYDTPPTPPANRLGRASIPGPPPAPAPDAFYGVQRMGAEVPASESAWRGKWRTLFDFGDKDDATQGGS